MHQAIENLIKSGRVEEGMWWEKALRLVEGCQKVSEGCRSCWSETQCNIRSHNPKMVHQYPAEVLSNGKWNGKIKLLKQNLELPLKRKKSTVWAIWNDLMLAPIEFIDQALEVVAACPQHIFILCTKHPELLEQKLYGGNVLGGGDFFPNLWLMTTAENQEMADKRIPELLRMYAFPVKGVSVEPMLGLVDLKLNERWCTYGDEDHHYECETKASHLSWIICGMESLGSRPGRIFPQYAEAIRSVKNQCVDATVPFFFKQAPNSLFETAESGRHKMVKMPKLDGKQWKEFPNV